MWTISATGPKDNVLNKIQNAAPPVGTVDEVRAFRLAQEECRKQVEDLTADVVTVLASGRGEESTITVGSADPPPPEPKAKAKTKAKSEDRFDAFDHTKPAKGDR